MGSNMLIEVEDYSPMHGSMQLVKGTLIEGKDYSPMHEPRDIDTSKKNTPDIITDLSM